MNAFKAGLLAGAVLGSITAASVFAQFGTPSNTPMRAPQAMNNAERREVLARCDGMPMGPAKEQCVDDLLVNRNAAAATGGRGMASRAGDGRTGAPGIGTGPGSMTNHAPGEAGQGARANRP